MFRAKDGADGDDKDDYDNSNAEDDNHYAALGGAFSSFRLLSA